jgi:methyl-accepting chemotaxis protein
MKKKFSAGIKTKFLVSVVSVVFLILLTVSVTIYLKAADTIKTGMRETISAESASVSKSVNESILVPATVVQQMGNNALFTKYIEKVTSREDFKTLPEYPVVIETLKSIRATNSNFSAAYIALDGISYIITDGEWENPPDFVLKEREWYKSTISKGVMTYTDPYLDANTGQMVITISIPLKNSAGKVLGVAGADVTIDKVSEFMKEYKAKETGYALLVDSKGTVLYHPDSELILKDNITKYEGKAGEIGNSMVKGESDMDTVRIYGQDQYMAYSPIGTTGWSSAVIVAASEVEKELAAFRNIFAAAILIALILLFIVVYLIAGSILKPIPSILKSLEIAKDGDLTARANIKSNDEIGLIAKNFNHMMEAIHSVIKEVQDVTGDIAGSVATTSNSINELSGQIEEVSATTQELSAGMEETAASTEEMNATTTEIDEAVESIATKAQDGASSAGEISSEPMS